MNRGKCFLAPNNSQDVYGIASLSVPDYTKQPVTAIAGKNVQIGKSAFSGKFDQVKVGMYITKVIYNNPVTIVFWSDNTKTMSRAQHGDVYSKETGLALCILKKLVGGDQVASVLRQWAETDENVVDIKLLRQKSKLKSSKKIDTENDTTDIVAPVEEKRRKK